MEHGGQVMRPAGEANSLAREIQGAAASSEIIAAAASSEFWGAATSSEIKSAATIAPRGDGRRVELRCPQKAALRAPEPHGRRRQPCRQNQGCVTCQVSKTKVVQKKQVSKTKVV